MSAHHAAINATTRCFLQRPDNLKSRSVFTYFIYSRDYLNRFNPRGKEETLGRGSRQRRHECSAIRTVRHCQALELSLWFRCHWFHNLGTCKRHRENHNHAVNLSTATVEIWSFNTWSRYRFIGWSFKLELNPWDHEFYNVGRWLYGHHNYAFISSW